jgi:hypothetical protein
MVRILSEMEKCTSNINFLIPLMQKFILRHIYIYLFLRQKRGIMKATIYKGFTYVHCLFVVAGIGVENGHQQSPRFNLPCTSRACSLKVLPK